MSNSEKVGDFIGTLAVLMAITFIGTWVVHWAWEDIAVAVFHAPVLTYWQVMLALIALRAVHPTELGKSAGGA